MDPDPLRDVKQGTEEQGLVVNLFKAMPTQPRAYTDDNPGIWNYVQILRIQRVENGAQMDGSVLPYYRRVPLQVSVARMSLVRTVTERQMFLGFLVT